MQRIKEGILQVNGIEKSFASTKALINVSFDIFAGEVVGLIGENGSGKSTMSSIIAGVQKPDNGNMTLSGKLYKPITTAHAMEEGVSMVVQEQGTIGKITVAANIFLGKEEAFLKKGLMNIPLMTKKAQDALDTIGANHIRAVDQTDCYSFEDRKLVEVARSLYGSPKLWIIDETTNALSLSGRDILYRLIKERRRQGGAVLFVSHDLDEVMSLCDRILVLRDGAWTATLSKEEFDVDKIKQLMIGRELSGHYYRTGNQALQKEVVLTMNHLVTESLTDISLELHRGEILGVGGLSDSGIHDLGRAVCGLIRLDYGTVTFADNTPVTGIAQAIGKGLAYLSKDRDTESMMTACSIRDNICLPSLSFLSRLGYINRAREKSLSVKWMDQLAIKSPSEKQFCNTLSGGNKQKVVLAKWLARGADIWVLDCPTRGIDIGAKASVYELMEDLLKNGKSMILISEELTELIGMSDRIAMFRDGKLSGVFLHSENITESMLIENMI